MDLSGFNKPAFGQSAVQDVTSTSTPKKSGSAGSGLRKFILNFLPGGSLVNKKIDNEKIDRGDIIEEVALTALPFGLGKVAKGARGATAVAKAVRGGDKVSDAIKTVRAGEEIVEGATKAGKLSRTGSALKAEARGVKPGAIVEKGRRLDTERSGLVNSYIDSVKGAKKSVPRQLKAVEDDIAFTGKQIGDTIAANNKPITIDDLETVTRTVKDRKVLGGKNLKSEALDDVKLELGQARSMDDLYALEKRIDDDLQNFYGKVAGDRTTKAEEKILKAYRDGIDELISDAVPGAKDLKTRYSVAKDAQKILQKNANPSGLRILGLQTGVGGEGIQAGKDVTGRALSKVGGVTEKPFVSTLLKQGGVRAGADVLGLRGDPQEETVTDTDLQTSDFNEDVVSESVTPEEQPDNNPFGAESIQRAIVQDLAKNEGKNVDKLLKLHETFGAVAKPTKPLSSEASKTVSNAQVGLEAIGDFENLIGEDSGAFGRTNLPGVGFLDRLTQGRVSGALGTTEIDAAADQIVDVLARLRTGAAISKQEETRFARYIPRPGDSPEAVQQKLGYLQRQFQRVAQRASGSTEVDPSQALQGATAF